MTTLLDRSAEKLARRISRRSFLQKTALVGAAIAVAPKRFLLEPRSAFAAATRYYCDSRCATYSPGGCNCGSLCCQGWTEFCCATHPATGNACPPGTIPAGWWRADGSGLCNVGGQPGPRYYVDCNATCAPGCTDTRGSTCGGSCHDFACGCAQDDCSYRKTACNRFRYGQCSSDVALVGAVVCRYVSCTPPWQTHPECSSSPLLYSNATASHDRACLHPEQPGSQFPGMVRLFGASRFETAVAVSEAHYPDGATGVFIANGHNFPDALAGGAVAGILSRPILLVGRDVVPTATRTELTRLGATEIVIFGGESVVSEACATALTEYGTVTRLAGADRYGTAVEISKYGFASTAAVVVIANGSNYPDAVVGGPLGAALDGPVLLTRREALDAVTRAEILRLSPGLILVTGGSSVVSDEVVADLATIASTVRIAASDRYGTAVAVSVRGFPTGAQRVYVALGTDFPDALAGGAVAGAFNAPVLLVPRDSVPGVVRDEVIRLNPDEIFVLGGTAVIADSVAQTLSGLVD